MSLPAVEDVRQRIDQVQRSDTRACLMAAYLFCARVSEIVAEASPSDTHTSAHGPCGTDVRLETFEVGPLKAEVAIFKVATTHGRGGRPRLVALPLDRDFEPWTHKLYTYFLSRGEKPVFPFTRQLAWKDSKEVFEGLSYPIERYKIRSEGGFEVKVVDSHVRDFRLHALRHLRATELIEVYGFDGFDMSIYGGWTLRSAMGVGGAMERYAHLQWRKYFPKLLKKRRDSFG